MHLNKILFIINESNHFNKCILLPQILPLLNSGKRKLTALMVPHVRIARGRLRVTFAKNQTIEKNRWSNFALHPLFILKLVYRLIFKRIYYHILCFFVVLDIVNFDSILLLPKSTPKLTESFLIIFYMSTL